MEEICMKTPFHWEPINSTHVEVKSSTIEFQTINLLMREDGFKLVKLIREQQLHRYGLFILREQFLALYHPEENYFRVRRYVAVPLPVVELALTTNLDHRRCDCKFLFTSHIQKNLGPEYAIFIVCVVTWDLYADVLVPSKSSDYFIEYVTYIEENTGIYSTL